MDKSKSKSKLTLTSYLYFFKFWELVTQPSHLLKPYFVFLEMPFAIIYFSSFINVYFEFAFPLIFTEFDIRWIWIIQRNTNDYNLKGNLMK